MGVTTETIQINSRDNSRRGIQSAKNNLKGLQAMASKARAGLAGIVTVSGLAALKTLASRTLNAADEIEKLGRRSGASARLLSEMRHGLSQSDIEMSQFEKGLIKINKSSQDAADGLSTPRRAFEKLGISVEKFQQLDTDQKFITLSEAISRVEDPAIRNQVAMDIMGRSGVQLLTVMENGAAGIQSYREEAERLGMSLSQDQVEGAAAANDAIDKLSSSMSSAIDQAILPYTDEIARAADFTREYLPKAIEFLINIFRSAKLMVQQFVQIMVDGLLKIVEVGEGLPKVGEKFKGMGDVLRSVSDSMQKQIAENTLAMNGQKSATEAAADAQKQAADIAARNYTPSIIDNERALRAQATTADDNKRATAELVAQRQRQAEADRQATAELDRLNAATGVKYLRTQQQMNRILDEANTYQRNYAAGLEMARKVLESRGLVDGTEAYKQALIELGFQLEDVQDKTREATTTAKELWANSVGSVQGILKGFFSEGLRDFDSWYDNLLDSLADFLATFAAQWAASGIMTLVSSLGSDSGLDWSGFNLSNAFAGSDASATRAAGAIFGESAGNAFGDAATAAGSGYNLYGNVQGVEAGLDQGGVEGYTAALVSAYQAYENGAALYTTISGLMSTGTTSAIATSAELAASFSELSAAVSAMPETLTIASTTAETTAAVTTAEGAATTGGAASGAVAAAAFWAAAAIAVDQIFFDGRAGEAGFKVHDNRKDNLGQTGFTTLKTELYENPRIFLKDLFGARSFEQIVHEDYLSELFGRRDAIGANGGRGFNGGNLGVFGNDYGNARAGLSALQLGVSEKGNGGFFTGAQSSLDAFQQIAEAAGFATQSTAGFLEVFSETQSVDVLHELWSEFDAGVESAVTASERFATAVESNMLGPQNTLYQNLSLATGKNADAAREAILQVDKTFDEMVAGGMDATQAVTGAFALAFELSAEESAQFFARSGLDAEHWAAQLTAASGDSLAAVLDFNHQGVTAFEELNRAIKGANATLDVGTPNATEKATREFSAMTDQVTAALGEVVAESQAANDSIVADFERTRNEVEGSWQGLNLGDIRPIRIPSIGVPAANDVPHLGAYNTGGSFIVPGSGNSDRLHTISLTPGEQIDVTPANKRKTAPSTAAHNRGAADSELVGAVMALVDKVDSHTREAVKLQNLLRKKALAS